MRGLVAAVVAAVLLSLTAGCATGTVVDKGYRVDRVLVNGKPQFRPCWWVKFRDGDGATHTACTSRAKWKHAKTGDQWGAQ
ncbi:hypothetical protein [Kribbella solani]|uniref:Uncharacterized protein n=1 Tax=Kribbella solani TaxID=236067 RepID=A0A841E696_9ACTN|nr:hypothetical protein [Kribbella solani]MBB5982808.1 hypothetical protein [Kribbella solani]